MAGVLGLDGCKAGWIGVVLVDDETTAVFGTTADAVVQAAEAISTIDVIAIDIPIGIPEAGRREADALARAMLAGRASSVFSTPIRAALEAPTFADANAASLALTGKGLSQQSYALRSKILEIDDYLGRATIPVIEVHPEVVFTQMNGMVPVPWSKKTWAGHERRRALLAEQGIVLSVSWASPVGTPLPTTCSTPRPPPGSRACTPPTRRAASPTRPSRCRTGARAPSGSATSDRQVRVPYVPSRETTSRSDLLWVP